MTSMNFYEKYLLPKILNGVMKSPDLADIRAKLVPEATGNVLEVGIGSGLNLPFYEGNVKLIVQAGFTFDALAEGYIPGPKFATYNFRGIARPV